MTNEDNSMVNNSIGQDQCPSAVEGCGYGYRHSHYQRTIDELIEDIIAVSSRNILVTFDSDFFLENLLSRQGLFIKGV